MRIKKEQLRSRIDRERWEEVEKGNKDAVLQQKVTEAGIEWKISIRKHKRVFEDVEVPTVFITIDCVCGWILQATADSGEACCTHRCSARIHIPPTTLRIARKIQRKIRNEKKRRVVENEWKELVESWKWKLEHDSRHSIEDGFGLP